MAKAKLGNIDPRAFSEARGRIMLSDTKHGAVFSKWPKKRGKAKSGYNFYRQTEFGLIAKWAANPLDLDLGTAVEMARGTEQVPRDILMMAAMGLYYEIVSPTGIVWESARMTSNPQYILDLVSSEYGGMLWRDTIGWVRLAPGMPGQVLLSDGNRPYWGAAGPAAGGLVGASNIWEGSSTSNYASKGALVIPILPFTVVAMYGNLSEIAGQTYRWGIYEVNASNTILAVVAQTAPWVAPGTQLIATAQYLPTPVTLTVGKRYAFLLTRTSGTNTTSCGLRAGTRDAAGAPLAGTNTYLAYARNNPGIGDTVGASGDNPYSYGFLGQMG